HLLLDLFCFTYGSFEILRLSCEGRNPVWYACEALPTCWFCVLCTSCERDPGLRRDDKAFRGSLQGTSPKTLSVRGEVSNHERRGELGDCPSIPHHARGFP